MRPDGLHALAVDPDEERPGWGHLIVNLPGDRINFGHTLKERGISTKAASESSSTEARGVIP
jgi:hypothetical protein